MRDAKKDSGKLWDSGDEESSSDEDFHWLQKRMQEADGELDADTMKLLRGVVQQPFKERKHPERYSRPGYSDEDKDKIDYGDEEGEQSELDLGKAGLSNFVRPGNQFMLDGLDPNEKGISREE